MSDTPAAAPVSTTSSDASADARAQKSRAFLINIMLMFFVSTTVFVVGTYFFVIPYLYDHENRINDVRAWAHAHKEWHDQAEAAANGAAEAPAVPGEEAPAPAAPEAPAANPAPAAEAP